MRRIRRREMPLHENSGSENNIKLSKDKKENIKSLAFLNLMKVLKEKNMYPIFRASVAVTPYSGKENGNGISSIYFHLSPFSNIIQNQGDNPFTRCMTYRQLLDIIDDYINHPMVKDADEQTLTQIYITECINTILHCCVERHLHRNNIKILEEIGQEAFNNTCKKLYGEDFEDKTVNLMPPQARQMQDIYATFLDKYKIDPSEINREEYLRYFAETFRNATIQNGEARMEQEVQIPRFLDDRWYTDEYLLDYDGRY